MALQSEDALSSAHIPDLCRVVEGGSHHLVTVGVEMQRDDLGVMAFETENLLTSLHVPQLGRIVH